MKKRQFLVIVAFLAPAIHTIAQQTTSTFLTTGVGINKFLGRPKKAFNPSIAFNSGFEKAFSKNWFGQVDINFNALRYDQQIKDAGSDYFFQNTNSSLFIIGLNAGKDFHLSQKWFYSTTAGAGYISIGEPRLTVDEVNNIVRQDVSRIAGVLGKLGGRLGFDTKSKILQTIYLDGSYWRSTITSQGGTLHGISGFLGLRMKM